MEDTAHDKERQHIAIQFYNCLYQEVNSLYQNGKTELKNLLESEDGLHETVPQMITFGRYNIKETIKEKVIWSAK